MYESTFIKRIFDEFWGKWQLIIIWRELVPYLGYLVVSIYYIKVTLEPDELGDSYKPAFILCLGIVNSGLWLYQLVNEVK